MSAFDYARSRVIPLTIAAIGIISACVIAAVCGCPRDAVALMAAILLICVTSACIVEYLRTRHFYLEIKELTDTLEHPYQLHSLLSEPASPDLVIVYEALKSMGTVSADEVARANAKADEHREFVEGWVHGVKAPLASCELIVERVPEPERSQLAAELDRMKRKVDAALWYARSDCANSDYAIHETALIDIPRQACRENARFLIEQSCIPEIDISEEVMVFTDKKQAVFIVTQIVENAAKYGARHLQFSTNSNEKGTVKLQIQDDGQGIPASDVGRVFERGFTGTRGREDAASTGMGLYLAARLCEQLGLELSISSIDGTGTCATLSFPLDRRRFDLERDKSVREA